MPIRILAERSINPESRSNFDDRARQGTGEFITSYFNWAITREERNLSRFVRSVFRNELNAILEPEDSVESVYCQDISSAGMVQIVLGLEGDSLPDVLLAQCGSGLRTVFQVLVSVLLLPKDIRDFGQSSGMGGMGGMGGMMGSFIQQPQTSEKDINFFLFEELENNLHPSTLRRLMKFISKKAQDPSNYFFITTHSPVVIDAISNEPDTQILHVQKNRGSSSVEVISSVLRGHSMLDDLGVKASEILQANCVIWVKVSPMHFT